MKKACELVAQMRMRASKKMAASGSGCRALVILALLALLCSSGVYSKKKPPKLEIITEVGTE